MIYGTAHGPVPITLRQPSIICPYIPPLFLIAENAHSVVLFDAVGVFIARRRCLGLWSNGKTRAPCKESPEATVRVACPTCAIDRRLSFPDSQDQAYVFI